jgi:hypothetical protein
MNKKRIAYLLIPEVENRLPERSDLAFDSFGIYRSGGLSCTLRQCFIVHEIEIPKGATGCIPVLIFDKHIKESISVPIPQASPKACYRWRDKANGLLTGLMTETEAAQRLNLEYWTQEYSTKTEVEG